jgi:four helix bundle protein
MRDHRRLKAFQLADALALEVYRLTQAFPREEMFGLTAQMRRSAVSAASNIVEGCARRSEADYLHFLDMAHGSAHELEYQATLALRLGYVSQGPGQHLARQCAETCKVLNGLIRALRDETPGKGTPPRS